MKTDKLLAELDQVLTPQGAKRRWLETTPPAVIAKLKRGGDDLLQKIREGAETIERAEAELRTLSSAPFTEPTPSYPAHVEAEIKELRALRNAGTLSDEGRARLEKLTKPTGNVRLIVEYQRHLPLAEEAQKKLNRLLDETRKAIDAEELRLTFAGTADPETAALVAECLACNAAADQKADEYGEAVRALRVAEARLSKKLGTAGADRQLSLEALRERIHHSHAVHFEVDPASPGTKAQPGARGIRVLITLPEMTALVDRRALEVRARELYEQLVRDKFRASSTAWGPPPGGGGLSAGNEVVTEIVA